MDPIGSSRPKFSRASHLHVFEPKELKSILFRVTQTLQTQVTPQGTSSAFARTEPRPNLTTGQEGRGSSGKPTPPPLHLSGLGVGSAMVPGSTNPGDTSVKQKGFDGYHLDDYWT